MIHVRRCSCKVPAILVVFKPNLNFLDRLAVGCVTILVLGSLVDCFPHLLMSDVFYGKPLSAVQELLMEEFPEQ
jgi:hypothetical protein